MFIIKALVLFALGLVVWQLVTALVALSRGGKGDPERLLKALRGRVIFSILIVLGLFVMGAMGWLEPHSL